MSEISEEAFCAGWLQDLEYDLWRIVLAGHGAYGRYQVDEDSVETLRALSAACGGWIFFDDDSEETFIPLARWIERFNAHRHEK